MYQGLRKCYQKDLKKYNFFSKHIIDQISMTQYLRLQTIYARYFRISWKKTCNFLFILVFDGTSWSDILFCWLHNQAKHSLITPKGSLIQFHDVIIVHRSPTRRTKMNGFDEILLLNYLTSIDGIKIPNCGHVCSEAFTGVY